MLVIGLSKLDSVKKTTFKGKDVLIIGSQIPWIEMIHQGI